MDTQQRGLWLIDSHAHLDFDDFGEDLQEVLERAREAEVREMITIGCRLESCHRAIALAEAHEGIYATVGVHPHQAQETDAQELAAIRELLEHRRVVAVGECGLDYFYMNSPKETQQEVFRQQIRISRETGYPLIIHTRDAEDDTLEILRDEAGGEAQYRGVIHCFSGTLSFARACVEMGFYISLSGMITFVKSLQKVVGKLPVERLLVETDAPYLAPAPHRGQRNEPAYVRHTAQKVASLFGLSLEELAQITTQNTRALFGLEGLTG